MLCTSARQPFHRHAAAAAGTHHQRSSSATSCCCQHPPQAARCANARAGSPAQPTRIAATLPHAHAPRIAATPQGVISHASLEKAAALRRAGAAFVIVSGARTSTVLQRLPYLPAADAIIAENGACMRCGTAACMRVTVCQLHARAGSIASCAHWHNHCAGGRIWYPDPHGLTGAGLHAAAAAARGSLRAPHACMQAALLLLHCRLAAAACPLQEDLEWRRQLADVTGPVDQDVLPPLERQARMAVCHVVDAAAKRCYIGAAAGNDLLPPLLLLLSRARAARARCGTGIGSCTGRAGTWTPTATAPASGDSCRARAGLS